MWRIVCGLWLCCALVWGADEWQKVKDLKTGSDLRIYKKGAVKRIEAKSGSVTESSVVVVMKNEEVAIQKADIVRVDFRPPATKPTKSETRTKGVDASGNPTDSLSGGLSWGRDGWQTVFKR